MGGHVNLTAEVKKAMAKAEQVMKKKHGNPKILCCFPYYPARMSMPGMMDTVLNIGLCPKTLPGLIEKSGDARFAYDSYRRLIMMYADVVMEKAAGLEPADGEGIRLKLEHAMESVKKARGVTEDTALSADDLKNLCEEFKTIIKKNIGKAFPDDPEEQLWGGIKAVFQSWNASAPFRTAALKASPRLGHSGQRTGDGIR